MNILHTEASIGWGGQEIRILREAMAMRQQGHLIILAVAHGGILAKKASEAGFLAYELPLDIKKGHLAIPKLISIIRKHRIQIVNTHSSADAWLGGIAARLSGRKIIRTRHISASIKPGLNSYLLYKILADRVVTTCEAVARTIQHQAGISKQRCQSIPTGIDPESVIVNEEKVLRFKKKYDLQKDHFIIGTTCILRSWKGISDLLSAASQLKNYANFRWLIVGDGPCRQKYEEEMHSLGIAHQVIFTGFTENPFPAIQAMDVFTLLSTANEGVSQASLQAAFLKKPMITTTIGGLGEVCLDGITGYTVPSFSPQAVQEAVLKLYANSHERNRFGQQAHQLVLERFTFSKTIEEMMHVFESLS